MRTAPLLGITTIAFSALVLFTAQDLRMSQSESTAQLAGVVGIQVGVAANEINSMAEQLRIREEELGTEERQLRAELRLLNETHKESLLYLNGFTGLLFILLLLNFYFDHRARIHHEIHLAPHS